MRSLAFIFQCYDCLEVGLFLSSCPDITDVLGPVGPNSGRGDNRDHVQDKLSQQSEVGF